MILRRFTQHIKEQNWFAVGLDVIVVVVGIFLGMQVTDWNEDRKNESRTLNYYERLIEDLESEKRALLARLDYMAIADRFGHSALELLEKESIRKSSDFLIALYQASQIWTYSVQRATYDEILSSGVSEVIPEPELRTQLGNFYLNAEATRQIIVSNTPYRQQIRMYLPNSIQSAIRESCSDRYVPTERNLLILKLPETCKIQFEQKQIIKAVEALSEYSGLERELAHRLASISVRRSAIKAHLLLIDLLTEELIIRQNGTDK